ncbi:hypothetical protein GCM10027262_63930 [Nocardia tengchongensis]
MLRRRQRHQVGARAGGQRRSGPPPRHRVLLHPGGQFRGRGRIEQQPHRDFETEHGPETRRDAGRDQTVRAEREEGIVDADGVEMEYIGEGLDDELLDRRSGRPVGLVGGEHRFGQGFSIELAGRGQGDPVQRHDRGRDHVGRNTIGEMFRQQCGVDRMSRRGNDVRDQRLGARFCAMADRGGETDTLVTRQHGIDLAELDPEPSDLDLEVGPPEMLDRTVGRPADHITGPVHARTWQPRASHEPLRRQPRPPVVPPSQETTGDVQLTGHTHRHRLQSLIEYPGRDAKEGTADRDQLPRRQSGQRDGDRGLGGPVFVEQFPIPTPPFDELGAVVLAADHQMTQIR